MKVCLKEASYPSNSDDDHFQKNVDLGSRVKLRFKEGLKCYYYFNLFTEIPIAILFQLIFFDILDSLLFSSQNIFYILRNELCITILGVRGKITSLVISKLNYHNQNIFDSWNNEAASILAIDIEYLIS